MDDIFNEVKESSTDELEEGATLIEYAILCALIVVVCIVILKALGGAVSSQFSSINSALSSS